jgi:KDO2-lipid IV(A) lauroyltransferase
MKNAPLRHALEYSIYRALSASLRALPHAQARRWGRGLGRLAHALDARHRRVARKNLALAFPEWSEAERRRAARECFAHFGGSFCDAVSSLRLDRVSYCRGLETAGWEHFDEAAAAGHGVIVMSAHVGYWEVVGAVVGLYRGNFHAVGRPADNPHLDREMRRLRQRFDNHLIDKRGAARVMLRALQRHETIGILIDQRVLPREGIATPFFGRPSWTSPVLAKLSMRTGAPVVPTYAYGRPDGGYRCEFQAPIHPSSVDGKGGEEERVAALTASYLSNVESEIRRQPEQWLWLHDRWKDVPR